MGADPAANELGQTGGSAAHTHAAATGPARGVAGSDSGNDFNAATGAHTHLVDVEPASSLPPFVKLVYIMKN